MWKQAIVTYGVENHSGNPLRYSKTGRTTKIFSKVTPDSQESEGWVPVRKNTQHILYAHLVGSLTNRTFDPTTPAGAISTPLVT
jgi:hypothetical protein